MFDCVNQAAGSGASVSIGQWIRDWGDIVLTLVIAWAAVMQWIVAARLLKLQRTVESSHSRVKLFCRIAANLESPKTYARLQVSNLSGFAVWLEETSHFFAHAGEPSEHRITLKVQEVLEAGQTYRDAVSSNIQGFVAYQENPELRRMTLSPIDCTVRTEIQYWANGESGTATTPSYKLKADDSGLQLLQPLTKDDDRGFFAQKPR
jgi:hypothetical protein